MKLKHLKRIMFLMSFIFLSISFPFKKNSNPRKLRKTYRYKAQEHCGLISDFEFNDNIIKLVTSSKINLSSIGIQTIIYGEKSIFLKDFFSIKHNNDSILTFSIDMPFVISATANLICSDPELLENYPSSYYPYLNYSYKSPEFVLSKTHFNESSDESQIKCSGSTIYDRICTMKNVFYKNGMFVFYTKAKYKFPESFLSISPRVNIDSRFDVEPIVTHVKPIENSIVTESSYILSTFDQNRNPFLAFYEFLFPMFLTVMENEPKFEDYSRRFFFRNKDPFLDIYYSIFSDIPSTMLTDSKETIKFNRAIFGMKRLFDPKEEYPYHYHLTNKSSLKKLKEVGIKRMNLRSIPSNTVLYVPEPFGWHRICNQRAFADDIRSISDPYIVKTLDVRLSSLKEQVEAAMNARIIIGQGNVGLTNAFWMKDNSMLIELTAKDNDCLDWYSSIAEISSLKYHRIMDMWPNVDLARSKEAKDELNRCYNNTNRCLDKQCQKRLLEQIFIMGEEWKDLYRGFLENYHYNT